MRYAGESVRWKTSRRSWLGGRHKPLCLIALTDEATGHTLARFAPNDGLRENFRTLEMYLKRWGRPRQIRTDASKLFAGEAGDSSRDGLGWSQVRRALEELGIGWAPAQSPRDLGGAAPFFNAAREELVAELEAMRPKNTESLAAFLEWVFLPRWESKLPHASGPDLHSPLLPEHDLESALATVHFRTVSREGTVRLNRKQYRLDDRSALRDMAGAEVRIEARADGRILTRWKGTNWELSAVQSDGQPARPTPRHPQRKGGNSNPEWMRGFFDRPVTPIWRQFK